MFLRILTSFCLTLSLVASAQLARPKVNSLEARKHQMIVDAQAQAATQIEQLQKDAAKAHDSADKVEKFFKEKAVSGDILQATNAKLKAERNASAADQRLEQAKKSSSDLQAQLDDWDAAVLKSHNADPTKFKIDWDKGEVVGK